MDHQTLDEKIDPFFWVGHTDSFSVCLYVGEYKAELFQTREDEGVEGSGYDWESLARTFLEEQMSERLNMIAFDSEGSMFCAYSNNRDALEKFIISFKNACEDEPFIEDLFTRAEWD